MALPGGPLEICFSFDTTVSMTRYIDQVRARLQDMVQRLKADIAGIRIALFAHGDFYQKEYKNKSPYVIKTRDFTDDVALLCNFINEAETTYGGDWNECYEFVLNQAKTELSWSAGTNKVFVLIGDARPHRVGDKENVHKLDWKQELADLQNQGVKAYGVYCKTQYSGERDETFFKDLAKGGDGSFLLLEDFGSIFDFLMAICYREHGEDALQMYESEVRGRGRSVKDVDGMFTSLKKNLSTSSSSAPKLQNKTSSLPKGVVLPKPKVVKITNKRPTQPKVHKRIVQTRVQKRNTQRRVRTRKSTIQTRLQTSLRVKTRMQTSTMQTQVPNTTVMSKVAKPSKQLQKTTPTKLRREKVPATNFILREYPWSPWKLAFDSNNHGQSWKSRDSGVGYCKQDVFGRLTRVKAIYEFAVQIRPGMHKRVVFRNTSNGFKTGCQLEKVLGSKYLTPQIDNVLKNGCLVFVRRLVLKTLKQTESAQNSLKVYDYVWRSDKDDNETTRDLVKDDVVISKHMEVD